MASKYFTASSLTVYDGDVAKASDVNSISTAIEAGFDIVVQDFAASTTELNNAVSYATEWANAAEDTLISAAAGGDQVDDYSSLHHAAKASADATATAADLVQTNLDTIATAADAASTAADVLSTNADAASTAADALATAADLVATNQDTIDTAADLVQTNLDTIATAADAAARKMSERCKCH